MSLLFVHDHEFLVHEGLVYSDKLSYRIFQRYLDSFNSVTVFSRYKVVNEKPSLPRACGEHVSFVFGSGFNKLSSLVGIKSESHVLLNNLVKKHDHIISRLPSEPGYVACSYCMSMGKKFSVEVVGCAWDALWNYGSIVGKIYAPISLLRMKYYVYHSFSTMYVTNYFLQKRYPTKAKIKESVSNVELNATADSVNKNDFNLISSEFKIGLIGSFKNNYKGIHIAIRSLHLLKRSGLTPSLHILGSGDESSLLNLAKKLSVQNQIFFDGMLPPGDEVNGWLDSMQIYIQPSFQEGVPRALIEALGRGKYSIASTAGGIPQLLKEDYLIKPGDFDSLAHKILKATTSHHEFVSAQEENLITSRDYLSDKLNARRSNYFDDIKRNISQ